uniref:Uncharacterized protein n=1 Tax=Anguilla anguilla TaxID=7936 RepID=A0A0E9XH69_ANGAN
MLLCNGNRFNCVAFCVKHLKASAFSRPLHIVPFWQCGICLCL